MPVRLYSMTRNSAGWRVRIAFALKGVAYDYVSTQTLEKGAFRRINPQGLMPALKVDGQLVAQSAAILEYLEETYPQPPLLPSDGIERAIVRGFCQFITADMHPLNTMRVRKYLSAQMHQDDEAVADWGRHWSIVTLDALEEMLKRRQRPSRFCFGDTPGMADLHLVPQMYNFRRFGVDLTPYPLLVAADHACRDVPAFVEAAPERMSDYTGDEPAWRTAD